VIVPGGAAVGVYQDVLISSGGDEMRSIELNSGQQ